MGKYTNWNDPIIDEAIDQHMKEIVDSIRCEIDPQAIILRGSFARGEGSVAFDNDGIRFLSDYELMAITNRHADREPLQRIARNLTQRLGVEISIARLDPKNLAGGKSPGRTIALYELQNSNMTLFGPNLLQQLPAADPSILSKWSALRMLLNRMAESIEHLDSADIWKREKWACKTVLACSEALLLVNGNYHFSYEERCRRFADLAKEWDSLNERAFMMTNLVEAATRFKLRPSIAEEQERLSAQWTSIMSCCDLTLRQVVAGFLGLSFDSYAEFPALYREALWRQNKIRSRFLPFLPPIPSQNAYLLLRSARDGTVLPWRLAIDGHCPAYQTIYSVIPLVFFGGGRAILDTARRDLCKVSRFPLIGRGEDGELSSLRKAALTAWKDYCYGLWETI